jgi:pyruvate formate lyase activating enzyme
MTAAALAKELLKDRAWFGKSDRGGVTLSGGEASAQPAFALETLRLCREAGIHTALDTCGVAAWEALERIYAEVDLVLYDLKEADPERHRAFTGLDNGLVLSNLERSLAMMAGTGRPKAMWIRSPVIPGATDREENFFALGRRIAELASPLIERWELCSFNNLCVEKYRRLGLEWAFAKTPLMTASDMDRLAAAARLGSRGLVEVSWTGSTRMEPERKRP